MITSIEINKLLEDYLKSGKVFGRSVDIFDNPTSSDLVKMAKQAKDFGIVLLDVRYIANAKNQKVHVFIAELAIHADVRSILGYSTEHYTTPELLNGEARFSNGKLNALPQRNLICKSFFNLRNYSKSPETDKLDVPYLRDAFKYNWNWLNQYVAGISTEINTAKENFNRILKTIK